jgi:ubiquinone/menaquinone biosynthesis C-methylase UbiE
LPARLDDERGSVSMPGFRGNAFKKRMKTADRSGRRVDYDQIASSYNQRYEASHMDGVLSALQTLARDLEAERIIEVGCGTGRWLPDLSSERRQVFGLDPSSGMLEEAGKRNHYLQLVRGRGGQLPFLAETFDLVFCVNAIHHFDDPQGFVSEARRVLGSGGALAVVGSDPHRRREEWYVYDFFDGTYETDLARFPTWDGIASWMSASGFPQVERHVVERIVDHKIGREVLEDPFLEKHACSQLALLSDEAYAAGLRRIEAALVDAEAASETLIFPTNILLPMIVGRKAGNYERMK